MIQTILVADDEISILEVVADILESEGYAVLRAHDGNEALALLVSAQPDLLLTDQMMPHLTGLDLIAYLHDHPELPTTVILMSAMRLVPVPHTVAFLPKPFDLDVLLDLIVGLLPAA